MRNKRRQILGQHMLVSPEIIDYEVAMAKPEKRIVLEIGGGTGNLTEALAKKAKQVITIEIDPIMVEELEEKFGKKKKIRIINEDFLEIPANKYGAEIIAGNIPYSASSPILFKLREWKFDHAVLCVQKEFAERMIAKPGDRNYSRLSVMSQLYFTTRYLRTVTKSYFDPVPEVDSAIIMIFPKNEKVNKERDELITKLFVHRKKTLGAALKSREFTDVERTRISSKAEKMNLLKERIFRITTEELFQLI
jgi:16S rRNA (adenine1518-N6/adenine1519-N6)-dimethyltransferase